MFIDDILIDGRTPKELTHHLRTVLEVLKRNKFYAKLKKCEFWLRKVAFLGYMVSKEGTSMDPQKIEAVTQWPRPKNSLKCEVRLVTAIEVQKLLGRGCEGLLCSVVDTKM